MRLRIHHTLFAGYLGIVVLLVILVVALVGPELSRQMIGLARGEVQRELALLQVIVEGAGAGTDPDSLTGAMTRRIGHRTTLIARDGVVLGDSDVRPGDLGALENHAARPEVVDALATGLGIAERESATRGIEFLYGAVPVHWEGETAVLRVAAPLEDVKATLDTSLRAVGAAGLLALAVALAAAYLVSRALARPLVVLSDRSQALARGDFDRPVPRRTHVAELDELAQAFNTLADELRARLQELGRERDEMQALIDCMAEGVVALTDDARVLRTNRAARALLHLPERPAYAPVGSVVREPELRDVLEASVAGPILARELVLGQRHLIVSSRTLEGGGSVTTLLDVTEIRRLEQVRRDFVANASHELKTPLTVMRGFAEALLDGDPPEHLRREFLESIRSSALRLQLLIDDLLDLSRLESGGWVPHQEDVELDEAAHRAWQALLEGSPRDLAFSVTGRATAAADAHAVEQILRNLLENARRHTPDGGRVDVRIGGGSDRVTVEVEDTGSGIPARALPRIFERFYRADPSRTREAGGTGLGLAIVRHLVQAMGGDVWARSDLGQGAVVGFSLPGAGAEPEASPAERGGPPAGS